MKKRKQVKETQEVRKQVPMWENKDYMFSIVPTEIKKNGDVKIVYNFLKYGTKTRRVEKNKNTMIGFSGNNGKIHVFKAYAVDEPYDIDDNL